MSTVKLIREEFMHTKKKNLICFIMNGFTVYVVNRNGFILTLTTLSASYQNSVSKGEWPTEKYMEFEEHSPSE